MNNENDNNLTSAQKEYEEALRLAEEAKLKMLQAQELEASRNLINTEATQENINVVQSEKVQQPETIVYHEKMEHTTKQNIEKTPDFQENIVLEQSNKPNKKNKNQEKKKNRRTFLTRTVAGVLAISLLGFSVGLGLSYGDRILEDEDPVKSAFGSNLTAESNELETEKNEVTKNEATPKVEEKDSTTEDDTLSLDKIDLLKNAYNSVVCVSVYSDYADFFSGRIAEQVSAGSAVFYAEDDERVYLLTNNHVIDGANQVSISMDSADDDEEEVEAHFIGKDPSVDVAVIFVYKDELEEAGFDYNLAVIGDSSEVDVFDEVYVIGNAAGEGKTQTNGSISSINKTVATDDGSTIDVLQTNASVNPGNSGGALVNHKGELIGINFAKLVDSTIEGIGYAIPINTASEVADDFIKNYNPDKPYLGISTQEIDEELKEAFNLPSVGVIVVDVLENSGADLAGIQTNDLIVGIDDLRVTEFEPFSEYLQSKKAGDTVTLYIFRNNAPTKFEVTLSSFSDIEGGF